MPSAIEISTRLKAARWLVGSHGDKPAPLSVEALAKRRPLVQNKITKNRIEEIEQAKTEARRMELEKIAEALGLPDAWFTAEDWRPLICDEPKEQDSKWRRIFGPGKPLSMDELDAVMPDLAALLRRLKAELQAVNAELTAAREAAAAPSNHDPDALSRQEAEEGEEERRKGMS